jgi:hypothetical protein
MIMVPRRAIHVFMGAPPDLAGIRPRLAFGGSVSPLAVGTGRVATPAGGPFRDARSRALPAASGAEVLEHDPLK